MKKHITTTACMLLLPALLLFTWGGVAFAATTAKATTSNRGITFKHACAAAPAGFASCLAIIAQSANGAALSANPLANPTGGNAPYSPANLHSAYNLPTTAAGTPTVAVVDAFNDPNAASDLATYRSNFGLPACTVASGCLKIVSQTGSTTRLPRSNTSWGVEESLDLDMVSAICQNCHILLVEASSASNSNLGAAENEAVSLGAIAVSNSFGENEFSSESSSCSSFFQHNNVAITASTGDSGPGVSFPAVCPTVTAVGGTTLNSNGSETAWNTSPTEGAGGGCSAFIAIPSWQSSSVTGCSRRAVGDVSADADPATGVAVFDSFGGFGWIEVGGTSESSPIIASVFALAGNVASTQNPASLVWAHYTTGLFEVGGVRYAFQTGLGSPDGVSDF